MRLPEVPVGHDHECPGAGVRGLARPRNRAPFVGLARLEVRVGDAELPGLRTYAATVCAATTSWSMMWRPTLPVAPNIATRTAPLLVMTARAPCGLAATPRCRAARSL